jgi:hypothetical protein
MTNSSDGEQRKSADVRTGYISGSTFGLKKVWYSAVNGDAIFEGDIVLGSVAELETFKQQIENPDPNVPFAVVRSGEEFRWPDGVIPFQIDQNLPNQQRVTDAIRHWEQNTNIRFRQRTNEADFVTFRPGGGCSSQVGRVGGEQFVTLATGCTTGSTIHEIGHVVGIWHEQSREDRDNFVTINWANIQSGMEHNFNQHVTDGDDIGPYDYGSIMHYPRNAFAINPNIDTITPVGGQEIGQRNGLSASDLAAANALYRRKATLDDTSPDGPALVRQNDRILLSWIGVGNLRLNFMNSGDGLTFGNKITLSEISPVSPALTLFNNRFVVSWIGVGNNQLNIMQSEDGLTWNNKITLGDTSESSPALAALGNTLFIAWRGVGNDQVNVMASTDGVNWTNKVTMSETTRSGPALTTLGGNLILAWRGVGNNQLNILQSLDGQNFFNKVTLGETTLSKPGLYADGQRVFLTWQGVGNRFLNVLASSNGQTWTSKETSRETCIGGPALSMLGNRLIWGWAGTDIAHRLNTILFSLI